MERKKERKKKGKMAFFNMKCKTRNRLLGDEYMFGCIHGKGL